MLKDPIIINTDNKDKLSEKSLKKYILKQLEHLFLELGYGFAYIGSEYKINIAEIIKPSNNIFFKNSLVYSSSNYTLIS